MPRDLKSRHGLTRTGRGWVKKINGVTRWVASLKVAATADAADRIYESRMSELWGRDPASRAIDLEAMCVRDLADLFLHRKDVRGVSPGTLREATACCQDFADAVGGDRPIDSLHPEDFARFADSLSGRFGHDRRKKWLITARGMFKFALKNKYLPAPPDYGDAMDLPTKADERRARGAAEREHGKKLYAPAEALALVSRADAWLRPKVLLGLLGFGATDLSLLTWGEVDLGGGWIDTTRNKTGVRRRTPLWPELVADLRAALAAHEPAGRTRELANRVFLSRFGGELVADDGGLRLDRLQKTFQLLAGSCGLARTGRSFYSLKRTGRTWMDEVGDQRAAGLVVGHELGDVGGIYVVEVPDERLVRVSEHVRSKLFGGEGPGALPDAVRHRVWQQSPGAAGGLGGGPGAGRLAVAAGERLDAGAVEAVRPADAGAGGAQLAPADHRVDGVPVADAE